MSTQGEAVSIEFNSTDATAGTAKVTIKDSNQATRTLLSYERLIIDTLYANTVAATVSVDVFADADADGTVDAGERIASFTATAFEFEAGDEGYSVPVGITPSVKAATAGAVTINGTGRIINGTGQSTPLSWKAKQLTGGNY